MDNMQRDFRKMAEDAGLGKYLKPETQIEAERVARAEATKLKDSGARQEFGTGSVRDLGTGKGAFELIQVFGAYANAKQLERGMQKYGHRNWEKGQPVSRYMQSAVRHALLFLAGFRDEPHLSAALWNLNCAVDTLARIEMGLLPSELNDLPAELTKEQVERAFKFIETI